MCMGIGSRPQGMPTKPGMPQRYGMPQQMAQRSPGMPMQGGVNPQIRSRGMPMQGNMQPQSRLQFPSQGFNFMRGAPMQGQGRVDLGRMLQGFEGRKEKQMLDFNKMFQGLPDHWRR